MALRCSFPSTMPFVSVLSINLKCILVEVFFCFFNGGNDLSHVASFKVFTIYFDCLYLPPSFFDILQLFHLFRSRILSKSKMIYNWPSEHKCPCLSSRDQRKKTSKRHFATLSRFTVICNELSVRSLNGANVSQR